MAQDDLIPFTERSEDEVKEMNRRGGINSGAVRRKKAAMRDYAQFILGIKRKVSDKTLQQLREMGISEEEVTGQTLALMKIMDKAIAGDIKAMEFLRDTAGEKPTDSVKMTHEIGDGAVIRIGYEDDE